MISGIKSRRQVKKTETRYFMLAYIINVMIIN